MSYKARIFTREEFGNVIAAAIYDYDHAPAKITVPNRCHYRPTL